MRIPHSQVSVNARRPELLLNFNINSMMSQLKTIKGKNAVSLLFSFYNEMVVRQVADKRLSMISLVE